MTTYIQMPGVIRGVEWLRLDRSTRTDAHAEAVFTLGVFQDLPDQTWEPSEGETEDDRPLVSTFVQDGDMSQPRVERIEGDEFAAFLAWALVQEGLELSDVYGTLENRRTVMRWIAWRTYRTRLSDADYNALLPTLLVVLDTEPPDYEWIV